VCVEVSNFGILSLIAPVCPVLAIFALDDLLEKSRYYAEIDASYVVGGKFQPDKFKK